MTKEELKKLLAVFDVYVDSSVVDNRKKIIESISKMDTQSLSQLLNDEFTYGDVPKVDFLNNLDANFNRFKELGNSFLEVHKGHCMSNFCDTKDAMALSFVCNKTRDTLNLIFKESNDEFSDIFVCNKFRLNDDKVQIKSRFENSDIIFDDDFDLPF